MEKNGPPQWFLDALEEDKKRKTEAKEAEGHEGQPALEDAAAVDPVVQPASEATAPAAAAEEGLESMD